MTWYQSIRPLQSVPIDLGYGPDARATYTLNVLAVKAYSETFLEELLDVLQSAQVGQYGVDIFLTTRATIPKRGSVLSLIETGGMGSIEDHNNVELPAYQRPTAKITSRADTVVAAQQLIWAAYRALCRIRNVEILPVVVEI